MSEMRIGAQLFTVRDYTKTIDDLRETLKKTADIGYEYVQISGTCGYDPLWMKEELDKNGLKCPITHTNTSRMLSEKETVVKDHDTICCDHIGIGYWKFEETDGIGAIDDFAEKFRPVAEYFKENGKKLMYHNHYFEFRKIDGKHILSLLAEKFEPSLLGFTLDTYWAQFAGADPAYFLDILKGRVPCIHLKDCGWNRTMEAIGQGNINFDRVFASAEAAGTKYMFVEQDNCNGLDPFDCLKTSYDYLKSKGFN